MRASISDSATTEALRVPPSIADIDSALGLEYPRLSSSDTVEISGAITLFEKEFALREMHGSAGTSYRVGKPVPVTIQASPYPVLRTRTNALSASLRLVKSPIMSL